MKNLKKQIFAILLSTLTVISCGCSSDSKIKIGTAGAGGIYNEFGFALAKIINDNTDFETEVKSTTGSAANVRLISKNYLDLAIAQSDIINDAFNGEGTFTDNGSYSGYYAIAGLYTEACQIVVRNNSDIQSIGDLQYKTVSIGEKESGTEQNALQILSAYGLTPKMLKEVNLDYTESAKQLESGEIDAFFCTAGTNATVIAELAKQCDVRLLGIEENQSARLKTAYKFYTDYTIPANTYKGQAKEIKTLGVKSVLVANKKLSDDKVEQITKLLFEHSAQLQYIVSADLELDEKRAVEGIPIPFHKGASAYYSSKGIETVSE